MQNAFAIIVTVTCYDSPSISDLDDRVERDGNDISALLRDTSISGYPSKNVLRLNGTSATADNVRKAIHEIRDKATAESPAFFYFSGHGIGEILNKTRGSSLVCYDADLATAEGLLSTEELANLWGEVPSLRKLFVVDACFSGGIKLSKSAQAPKMENDVLTRLSEGRGSVVMASSRFDETSAILGTDKNSIFTKHLLNGMKGYVGNRSDGYVRVFDLFTYVAEGVRSEIHDQHPVYFADSQEDNFPITYCAKPEHRKDRKSPSGKSEQQEADLLPIMLRLYPQGPHSDSIWERAGGEISEIQLTGNGKSDWFQAIKRLRQGGGGKDITEGSLISAALSDFPRQPQLLAIEV